MLLIDVLAVNEREPQELLHSFMEIEQKITQRAQGTAGETPWWSGYQMVYLENRKSMFVTAGGR